MPRVSVRLNAPLYDLLRQASEIRGITRSEVIQAALRAYLDAEAESQPDFAEYERRLNRLEQMAGLD